ncbi:MAG: recombinase family protein [Stenomitos rutilans HA7619-LM2]|jgi:DNA invertase Pin-like site-specific DNA recombinase|nr:recombinase family protein [Stenomitos rutilans HA7619-LM2]MBW4469323.1 recombinase family protein [Stenomitos rutilans HA7619-LM2]
MILGYARESTLKAEQDQALAWQIQRLQRYGCDRILTDRMSGASKKRPGYKELLALIDSDNVTEVVVCSVTRLGRSTRQMVDAIDLFAEKKVKFTSLDGKIDIDTASGRANVQMQAVFAQLERELIQERINAGYDGIRANRMPIHAPFGYRIIDKRLEIDVDVETIARWIRQSVIDVGLIKTTQAINLNHKDLTKIPRSPGGIKTWLQCETIYGNLWYDRHNRRGKTKIYYNNHPALFTQQERLEVEESLSFRQKHHGFKSDPVRFPLTGLIYCAECGSSMSVSYKHDRVNPIVYYRCYKGVRRSCPNNKYMNTDNIQKAIIIALVDRSETIAARAIQAEQKVAENPGLLELRKQLIALVKLPTNFHIEAAIAGIQSDIAEIEVAASKQEITLQPDREKALKACSNPTFWIELKPEDKHSIYRLLVKRVVCRRNSIETVELWV